MSLKAELEAWAGALKAYDEQDYEKALELFAEISDTSKIMTNMGLIYATIGEHELAVEQFQNATSSDQYLAVAYFQCGVSNFLLARYDLSLKDFEDALMYLRGNESINYEQLGLKFKLYSAEVLFNKGLAQIYLGKTAEGLSDMEEARREKATEEHNVIDDAIQDRGEGYTVFSIPVGILYRPAESKIKNVKTKDYLGKAKLVAASDSQDAYTTFTGVTRLQQGITPTGSRVDAAPDEPSQLARRVTAPAPKPQNREMAEGATGGIRGRANTTREPTQGRSPPATGPAATRGLSVRKPLQTSPQDMNDRLQRVQLEDNGGDSYDDYIDSYADEAPRDGGERVANWAKSSANGARAPPPGRAPSSYAPSSYSGASQRRKPSRRSVKSRYEEDEEGYGSGDQDEGGYDLVKIRVKLHYQDDVRGMALTPDTPFEDFIERVTTKFNKSINGLTLKFRDEDGGKITLRDDSDYELAIETARDSAKGKPEGKLEIWCTDA